jgi:hypothetical protein
MGESSAPVAVVIRLTPDEVALLQAALRLLRSTLGHEEAEELVEVKALLAKLDQA